MVHIQTEVVQVAEVAAVTRGEERAEQDNIRSLAEAICKREGAPWAIVDAIVYTESRWQEDVRENHNDNGTVDVGLFQLNSDSWADISERIGSSNWDPYNSMDNLIAGIRYITYWHKFWQDKGFGGDMLEALTISSYAMPTDTYYGDIAWFYVNRVGNNMGKVAGK
jgi:hypothetical protein